MKIKNSFCKCTASSCKCTCFYCFWKKRAQLYVE